MTIVVCVIATAVVAVLIAQADDAAGNSLQMAVLTGLVASFPASVILELTYNYRGNKLSWQELMGYYQAIERYEVKKRVLMGSTRIRDEPSEPASSLDDDDAPKDIAQATWMLLPTIIPTLQDTLDSKKQHLTDEEIETLANLLGEYKQIRDEVYMILERHVLYNVLNHPDRRFLEQQYPASMLDDLPPTSQNFLLPTRARAR